MGECLFCGWDERQFWFSSFRAVFNLIRTSRKREERQSRERWEQTRMICDYAIAPHRKKGAAGRSFELPWDGETKAETVQVLTKKEEEELFRKWDEKVKNKFIQNDSE